MLFTERLLVLPPKQDAVASEEAGNNVDKCGVMLSGAPAGVRHVTSQRPSWGLLHLSECGIKDGQDQRQTRWWTARPEPRRGLRIRHTASYDPEAKRRSDFLL